MGYKVRPCFKKPRGKKTKHELPDNITISLVNVYPKELEVGTPKVVCSPVLIPVSYTIAEIWKQTVSFG